MTPSLTFSDYAEMINIISDKTVQSIFNETRLQNAFEENNVDDVQEAIHTTDAVKTLLCDSSLIKRIVDIQLKMNAVKNTTTPDETE